MASSATSLLGFNLGIELVQLAIVTIPSHRRNLLIDIVNGIAAIFVFHAWLGWLAIAGGLILVEWRC